MQQKNQRPIKGEEWKCLLTHKDTSQAFKIPISSESLQDLLTLCYEQQVSERQMPLNIQASAEHIKALADAVTTDNHKFCIFAVGMAGNGKTTLMLAFRQALYALERGGILRKIAMPIYSAKEIAEKARDVKAFRELCATPILGVDDVGTEPSEISNYGNIISPFTDLIEQRYANRLFTYVTTNLQPKDFARIYGERVADRLREMATIINYQNPSFRK